MLFEQVELVMCLLVMCFSSRVQSVEEILRCYSKEENPDLNRQFEFIIKLLNSGEWCQIYC